MVADAELEHYLTVLRRSWLFLALGILLPSIAALVFSSLARPVYQARATVLVVTPTMAEQSDKPAPTTTARSVFSGRVIAEKMVSEFKLGPAITPSRFSQEVLRVDEVSGTSLLNVNVRLSDPQLAARVANRVAELAAERGVSLDDAKVKATSEALKVQLAEAEARLQAVQRRLLASSREGSLGILRENAESQPNARTELSRVLLEIAGEKASLRKIDEQIASASSRALRESLQYQRALSGSRLAGLDEQRRQLVTMLAPPSGTVKDGYDRELNVAKLEVEHGVLKDIYADLAKRYEQQRIERVARRIELQIVEPAEPPAAPVFPRRSRILAVAVLGGLVVSLMLIFIIEAVRNWRPGRHRTEPSTSTREKAAATPAEVPPPWQRTP